MDNKIIALYCRCSTMNNTNGLISQKEMLKQYISSNGLKKGDYLLFEDVGVSGSKRDRKGLNDMMRAIRRGLIHTVCVWSYSRLASSTKHLLEFLDELHSLDVDFVSLSEKIDTNTAQGKLMFTLISSFAEFEREIARTRILRGLEVAKKNGKTLGRPKTRDSELIQELYKKGLSQRVTSREF